MSDIAKQRPKQFYIATLGCKVNQYESEAVREAWLDNGHIELTTADGAELVLINSCAITAKAVADLRALVRKVKRVAPLAEVLVTGCAAQALPEELKELPIDTLISREHQLTLLHWLDDATGEADAINDICNEEQTEFSLLDILPDADVQADGAGRITRQAGGTEKATSKTQGALQAQSAAQKIANNFWAGSGPDEEVYPAARVFPSFSIKDYARSRAVLKIHDGCSQHCTYCIVPQGRGPSVSRPWAETIAEAARLIKAGFREIVLNGVNLRQYGSDFSHGTLEVSANAHLNNSAGNKENFWKLITRLHAAFGDDRAAETAWSKAGANVAGDISGNMQGNTTGRTGMAHNWLRFRISSLEPGQLDTQALEVLAASPLLAPHLHISLQSCSPYILKRMGRGHYNPATLPEFLEKLRQIWPVFGLGADFITGFPGETEEHFQETLDLVRLMPFSYAHVFPYSARPGTAAAKLPEQIAPEVKKERAARLRALISEKQQSFLQVQLQQPFMLLAMDEGKNQGVNEFYADCRLQGEIIRPGRELIKVKPVGLGQDKDKGKILVQQISF